MKLQPGFKQFLWKTGVFVVLFAVIQLIILLINQTPFPKEYYFILDVDIGKTLLLTAMIFFFLTRDKLKELKEYKFELGLSIGFGILCLVSFGGYFFIKEFILANPTYAIDKILLFYPLKELTLVLGTLFLFVAIFGYKFSKDFVKKFKKEIRICVLIFALGLFLIIEFQRLWPYFSLIVSKIVYWILNLTFEATLSFNGNLPRLGILDNFVVEIGKPCSGVDSMMMFVFLYLFIAGFDWEKFNKKKLLAVFIPGIIGVFLVNVLRIYLLITIGAFVSQGFAIGFFHTNASMVLFLGYFILFWGLLYKWMKK